MLKNGLKQRYRKIIPHSFHLIMYPYNLKFEEAQQEKRIGVVQTYDAFAASILQLGLVGIWSLQPLIDGKEMKSDEILPNIPKGPSFRDIMDEQEDWMITHPGGSKEQLVLHLREKFHEYI